MAKALIIDGNALMHRSFHALPPLTNKFGPIGAVYGFFSILLRALQQIKPDYLFVAFDHPGPNFRHQLYIGYQLKRPEMDANLTPQLKLCQEMLAKADIPILIKEDVEADDVIGSLARRLRRRLQVYILTGDRDLMQLVRPRVRLLTWQRRLTQLRVVDRAGVEEELGIKPRQVVDYKALVGDSSDEYPGVAGVGPKTAGQLLQKYGRLEAIYQHLAELPPRWREKLEKGKNAAYLSQKLATIVTNLPVSARLQPARWNRPKLTALAKVLQEYRFPSLARRAGRTLGKPAANPQTKLF